jgi:hypothetical protein
MDTKFEEVRVGKYKEYLVSSEGLKENIKINVEVAN